MWGDDKRSQSHRQIDRPLSFLSLTCRNLGERGRKGVQFGSAHRGKEESGYQGSKYHWRVDWRDGWGVVPYEGTCYDGLSF